MKEEFEIAVDLRHNSLMDIFEELSFSDKWRRVYRGLKSPHYTGYYKFAKLQLIRLSAPNLRLLIPLIRHWVSIFSVDSVLVFLKSCQSAAFLLPFTMYHLPVGI